MCGSQNKASDSSDGGWSPCSGIAHDREETVECQHVKMDEMTALLRSRLLTFMLARFTQTAEHVKILTGKTSGLLRNHISQMLAMDKPVSPFSSL